MLVADDMWWPRVPVRTSILLCIVRVCGRDTLVLVGVEKMASSATVHLASFEEGLGRIMFVAGALHERCTNL